MPARKKQPDRRQPGIEIRHARACRSRHGEPCDCTPGFRAFAWSARDGRRIQKTFPTEAAALRWREDARVDLRRGVLMAARPAVLREFADAWLAGAGDGSIRNRSGDRYKPSTIRGYEQALREYVLPELGAVKLQDLRRQDIQRLADELSSGDISAATVRNALLPLRAICRRALSRGDIRVNPTTGIEIPAARGRRMRFATPYEAHLLIEAAPPEDHVLWATAFYAGLRRGELQALRWADVDLAGGVLSVERSWDVKAGLIEPKSTAGRRKVPIAAILRDYLVDHRLDGREGLVFGRGDGTPFAPSSISLRAANAWKREGLRPITLHECRHTFASLMIAAGVNPKALQTFMGHSSITVTLDRYGHLFPGSEGEAAVLLDAYLAESHERARSATLPDPGCGDVVGKSGPSRSGLERS
ncbi:MAG: tyrosine-type recombinase/integrase [Solirubrobacteraceae bacterium]